MAEMWYYAKDGQQIGPVSGSELSHLTKTGAVRPSDLVWKEGTPNWVPASEYREFFPSGGYGPPSGSFPDDFSRGARRQDRYDREFDDRPPPKSNTGLIVTLIVIGVSVVVLLGCGGIFALIYFSDGGLSRTNVLTRNENLPFGKSKSFNVHMRGGRTYTIDLESNDFDAYLELFDSRGRRIRSDDDGGRGLNSRIRFAPTRSGTYRIEVQSLGRRGGGWFNLNVWH